MTAPRLPSGTDRALRDAEARSVPLGIHPHRRDAIPIRANGAVGEYEAIGTGPPVVLLASPLASVEPYRPTAVSLGQTFRVFTVGLPGCGGSPPLGEAWPVERYADWIAVFLRQQRLDRPLVIGHSHAGAVVVCLAARHPAAVGGLVVADATGTGPHRLASAVLGGLRDLALERRLVARCWHHVAGNLFRSPRAFVRLVRQALAADVRADARRVSVPSLVAWGGRDHTLAPRHAAEYARLLSGARLHVCPHGSHDWLITRAAEFTRVVRTFANEMSGE